MEWTPRGNGPVWTKAVLHWYRFWGLQVNAVSISIFEPTFTHWIIENSITKIKVRRNKSKVTRTHKSAEASMASGRVDAGASILKTLQSPKSWGGFPFPYPSHRTGSTNWRFPRKSDCLLLLLHFPANIQCLLFWSLLDDHENH